MTFPDFNARAELYLGSDHTSAQTQGGRHFSTVANAVRFALEEAAPVSLRGASLIVGNRTFSGTQLAEFYRCADYPLPRKTSAASFRNGSFSRNRETKPRQVAGSYRRRSNATAAPWAAAYQLT